MADSNKDTIYVDIDEEITGLIDKVNSSPSKVVALVLPKRATLLQSIVNMKLLKRAADESKKNLVLITAETGLLPLAGAVGIHVAKTLQSKPEIPIAPNIDNDREETVDEETAELIDDEPITTSTAATPIGGLAAASSQLDDMETIDMDDDDLAAVAAPVAAAKPNAPKKKKNAKLSVPNFERFRLVLLVVGLLLILLVVGAFVLISKLPKATIDIQTNASTVSTNVSFELSTTAATLDTTSNTVPAKLATESKTQTGTAAATGQQNNGTKAAGSIVMTTQVCAPDLGTNPGTVPAGTGVSANNLTYITQSDADFSQSGAKGSCINYTSNTVDITAQQGGTSYNTTSDNTTFTVAGFSGDNATGSASGGTDDIQTVVQQSDIDAAAAKISAQNNGVKSDLQKQLQQDNYYPISTTFTAGTPTTSDSTSVGDPAGSVTVTQMTTYTEYGARQDDLETLLDNNIKAQVNTAQQGILDDGFDNVSFITNGASPLSLSMTSKAEVGPAIDTTSIKQQAVGKKSADIEATIKSDSNVTGVTVSYSPFWVTTAPKNLNRITVNVAKPSGTNGDN
jgi:hypothetical protein